MEGTKEGGGQKEKKKPREEGDMRGEMRAHKMSASGTKINI